MKAKHCGKYKMERGAPSPLERRKRAARKDMKKTVWKIILLLPAAAALALEILPYSAALNFGVQAENGDIENLRVLTSCFDPLNFGYANFGPPLTAFLTCAALLCFAALFFSDKALVPAAIFSAIAFAASLIPLLYGTEYYTGAGAAISALLGAETIAAFLFRRFCVEKPEARPL